MGEAWRHDQYFGVGFWSFGNFVCSNDPIRRRIMVEWKSIRHYAIIFMAVQSNTSGIALLGSVNDEKARDVLAFNIAV